MYLGNALLGERYQQATHPVIHTLMALLSGSLAAMKAMPAIAHGLLLGAVFLLLRPFAPGRDLLAAAAALVIVFYPISADQTFYVVGSHPVWGLAIACYGLFCFLRGWSTAAPRGTLLVAAAGLLCVVATMTSPLLALAVFAPVLWVAVALIVQPGPARPRSRTLGELLLLCVPIAVVLARGIGTNNYSSKQPDRIVVSIDNVLPALGYAFDRILVPLQTGYILIAVLTVALVAVAALLLRYRRPGAEPVAIDFATPLMVLVLSALVFAPNITMVEDYLRSRYVVAPFIAGLLSLMIVVLQLTRKQRGLSRFLTVSLLAVAIAEVPVTAAIIDKTWRPQFTTQRDWGEALLADHGSWPDDATVLFILEPGHKAPNPWWTQPVAKYLTGSMDLFLVVEAVDRIQSALIGEVEDPRAVFLRERLRWDEASGRLEGTNPLYVYIRQSREEPFTLGPLVIVRGAQEASVLPPGARPGSDPVRAVDPLAGTCSEDAEEAGLMLFVGNRSDASGRAFGQLVDGPHSWHFDGDDKEVIVPPLETGQPFELSFRLLPDENPAVRAPYSDTYPPMPLITETPRGVLVIYHQGETFRIVHQGEVKTQWLATGAADGVEISIQGRQGCRLILSVNGKMLGVLPFNTIMSPWTLGRGFKRRFWSGRVKEWRLLTQ